MSEKQRRKKSVGKRNKNDNKSKMRGSRKSENRKRLFDKPKNSVKSKSVKRKSAKKLPGRSKKNKN